MTTLVSLVGRSIVLAFAGLHAASALAQDLPPEDPILRIEPAMHITVINRIGVDAACTRMVTGSDDKTARLWDITARSGAAPRLLRTLRPPIGRGHNGKIFAVAMSPNGKWVVAGGWNRGGGDHWVYVFEAATGRMVTRLGKLANVILHLTFSSDGQKLAATIAGGQGVRVWETDGWTLTAEDRDYAGASSYGAAFDGAGRLWTVAYGGHLRRYDKDFKAPPRHVGTSGGNRPFSVSVHPENDRIAVGFQDRKAVEIYDAETLELRFAADMSGLHNGDLSNVAWSTDGKLLFAGGRFGKDGHNPIRVWDRSGQGQARDLPGPSNTILSLVACGGAIAVGASDPAFGLVDARGRRLVWQDSIKPDMRGKRSGHFEVSADGRRVRFGLKVRSEVPVLFDLGAERLADSPKVPGDLSPPDSGSLPITDWLNSTKPKLDGKPIALDLYEEARSLAIAPDQERFVLGADWSLRAYAKDGRERWKKRVPGVAYGVNIPKGGKVVIAAYNDGTVRWHRLSDGEELLALFVHAKDRRWVAWTPKGYYMASPGAESLIGWHVNQGWLKDAAFFPVRLFRGQYYRPDVVQLVLETLGEDEALEEANRRSKRPVGPDTVTKVLPPVVRILSPEPGESFYDRNVRIRYTASAPTSAKITDLEVRVDGRPIGVRGAVPLSPRDNESAVEIDVTLPARDVVVSLIAWADEGGVKRASEEASVSLIWAGVDVDASKKPRLFALLVGVSKYRQPGLDLSWAAQDATDMETVLQIQEGLTYSKVETKLLTNERATTGNILEGLEWLDENTTQDDYAVIFLAGHGVTDKKQRFFYLPNSADPAHLLSTAVSRDTLVGVIANLAGRVLMFIDACHAADGLEAAGWGRVPADLSGLVNDLARAEIGAVMFASSTGREVSIERDEWRNGAFTEALKEGFAGKADLVADGQISTEELSLYISSRVEILSDGIQRPVMHKSRAIPAFVVASTHQYQRPK